MAKVLKFSSGTEISRLLRELADRIEKDPKNEDIDGLAICWHEPRWKDRLSRWGWDWFANGPGLATMTMIGAVEVLKSRMIQYHDENS